MLFWIKIYAELRFFELCGEQFGEQNAPLYREYNGIHLLPHKVIGEMRINFPHKPVRAIAHPNVYNVRAHVLLADGGKGVPQRVLRYPSADNFFENAVHAACEPGFYN